MPTPFAVNCLKHSHVWISVAAPYGWKWRHDSEPSTISHWLEMRWRMKNWCIAATYPYHCVAENSSILQMQAINLLKRFVQPQTQKKELSCCMDYQFPTPSSQSSPFSTIHPYFHRLGIVNPNTGLSWVIAYYTQKTPGYCTLPGVLILHARKLVQTHWL
jgi:hypothetical protein